MSQFTRRLSRCTWPATVLVIVLSAAISVATLNAFAAAPAATTSSAASEQQAQAVTVPPKSGSTAAAAPTGYCNVFVNAAITEYSNKSISFSSSNQCFGAAVPNQVIDVTLVDHFGNDLDFADNSCAACQVLGATGTWPGPAAAGQRYTMEISTGLTLPPDQAWTSFNAEYCVLLSPQTLSCQASASIIAQ